MATDQLGAIDLGFGNGANGDVNTTALQPDGKVIIGKNFPTYNSTARNRIACLNADGTLDASFDSGTGAANHYKIIPNINLFKPN